MVKNQIFQTTTDKGYVITEYSDGSWACSCPAWKFHRGGRVNCKHINEFIGKRDLFFKQQEANLVIQSSNSQDEQQVGVERNPTGIPNSPCENCYTDKKEVVIL